MIFLALWIIKSAVATYIKMSTLMERPRLANNSSFTHF